MLTDLIYLQLSSSTTRLIKYKITQLVILFFIIYFNGGWRSFKCPTLYTFSDRLNSMNFQGVF
jgi:hypothetical protein